MSATDDAPYNGTINGEIVSTYTVPTKEFYRLPLKKKNEIIISVKASTNASILLFDGSKSSDASDIKVEVVLGSDNNSTVSVGLAKDDGSGKYTSNLVSKPGILSATHFKTFTVRWAAGRVNVYNTGFKKPFVSWDGPKEGLFGFVGVRTVGCSGEWIVQGMKPITTADSKEYNEIEINSGRVDFEVCGARDSYLVLHPEAKFDGSKIIHYFVSCGNPANSAHNFYWNFNLGVSVSLGEAGGILSETEFRRFWFKWDATNIWFGRGGNEAHDGKYYSGGTPLPMMKYFSLQVVAAPFGYWHILDVVRPEDTESKEAASAPAGGDSLGYVVYSYNQQD